jgi:mannose-1-phosphate guanylyltransferase
VAEQAEALHESRPEIPWENFLIEPMPRGTASVVGLAAIAIRHRDPPGVMAVLTADHYIENEARFRAVLQAACEVARDGHLVTLGITPTYPSTGYGYIEHGDHLRDDGGFPVYKAMRFKEKPGQEQAEQMLEDGKHHWNSGMFIWQVDRILAEFHRQMPDLAANLERIGQAWGSPARERVVQEIWPRLKSETIDYGIMEHAQNVAVLPVADIGWNDVGSWESLFEVLPADQHGNIQIGADFIGVNTSDSLVLENGTRRLIVTIGLNDVVIIDTGDVLLVCDKNQSQQVRQVVNLLKREGRTQYL